MSDYEEGCYGDGSFGPDHVTRRVLETALSEGWGNQMDAEEDEVFERFYSKGEEITQFDEVEILRYIEDCALEFLNRQCCDENHCWGYDQGDFGYWRIDNEE